MPVWFSVKLATAVEFALHFTITAETHCNALLTKVSPFLFFSLSSVMFLRYFSDIQITVLYNHVLSSEKAFIFFYLVIIAYEPRNITFSIWLSCYTLFITPDTAVEHRSSNFLNWGQFTVPRTLWGGWTVVWKKKSVNANSSCFLITQMASA